ncbi:MAG: Aminotransferase class I and II [Thermotoga sp. 50_1627]|uniref:MalY/PatB family protein n=1 Tax=Pseudothermotoga sp. TaxID=2033661 RepID=UPI00076C5C46|nr:MAG: Aminotransferase class I and II [Thermotoga sp. 50_64]KUK25485.1 MAG: Aminotransferase class I and II [Thermotoga sp. 50_1627]MBC7115759.1 pyridoxal phosphate-dependent aminotransferase [Pseudothermotoga sp.]MDK2922976.1 cysteine-S-conjugate beta-lyase [Pseudothermotoga sp.]HBT38977.1 aminotransferase class I/II [Pseudothermotoga sp.]
MCIEYVDRSHSDCVKYDAIRARYGDDVLPAWIADMDVKVCSSILEAFRKRIEHGVFGYTFRSNEYYEAIARWYGKKHGFSVEKSWIIDGPGVMPMMALLINVLTEPGDEVVIQPPVYPPFFNVVKRNRRRIVENRLKRVDGRYVMDLEDLERTLASRKIKLIILSNPHNPVGRAWAYEELKELAQLCSKYGTIVISDEIHADIVYEPFQFTTMLKTNFENVIVLNSAGKSFNVPGLTNGYGIVPNEKFRRLYIEALEAFELTTPNIFGALALQVAYTECEEWLRALLERLHQNRDFAYNFTRENMPLIDVPLPEATFLMWLDCSNLGLENPQKFFLEKARVYLNSGADFGEPKGVRLNFACCPENLEKILTSLKRAYDLVT